MLGHKTSPDKFKRVEIIQICPQIAISNRNVGNSLTLPDFKAYYKVTVIKTVLVLTKGQNSKPIEIGRASCRERV